MYLFEKGDLLFLDIKENQSVMCRLCYHDGNMENDIVDFVKSNSIKYVNSGTLAVFLGLYHSRKYFDDVVAKLKDKGLKAHTECEKYMVLFTYEHGLIASFEKNGWEKVV